MRTCVDYNVCNQAYRKNCFNFERAYRDIYIINVALFV